MTTRNTLARLNKLWKERHDHDGDTLQEQILVVQRTVETVQDDAGASGSGAYIHLTAASQTVAVDGEDIEWAGVGSNGRFEFALPSFPVTEVTIPKAGYYNVLIRDLDWDAWTRGGIVEVWRTRDGVETRVWPPLSGSDWTSTGVDVVWHADAAEGIWFEAGDTVRVFLDHGDSSTQDLARAYLAVYLVDRTGGATGGIITACPILGSEVTVSSVDHDAFPGFAVADDGTHLITGRQGAGHTSVDGIARMRTSTDGGATWGAPTTIFNNSSWDVRSTSLTKLVSGRIVLAMNVVDAPSGAAPLDGGFTMYTDDAGANWSTPAQIDTNFTETGRHGEGTMAELADGSWLMGVFGRDTGDNPADRTVRVIKSSDDGANWSTVGEIADGETDGKDYNGSGLIRVGSQVIAFIRENTDTDFGGAMYRSVSSDDGATWSPVEEITIPGKTLGGISNPCLRSNGDLVIVWRDIGVGGATYPQSLYRSGDLGQTWEECALLDGSLSTYAQPAEDLNGKLGVAYADEVANDATSDGDVNFRKEA